MNDKDCHHLSVKISTFCLFARTDFDILKVYNGICLTEGFSFWSGDQFLILVQNDFSSLEKGSTLTLFHESKWGFFPGTRAILVTC